MLVARQQHWVLCEKNQQAHSARLLNRAIEGKPHLAAMSRVIGAGAESRMMPLMWPSPVAAPSVWMLGPPLGPPFAGCRRAARRSSVPRNRKPALLRAGLCHLQGAETPEKRTVQREKSSQVARLRCRHLCLEEQPRDGERHRHGTRAYWG